jgi:hypothetical protein
MNQGRSFPMAKYYVTMGRVRQIISAQDAEGAALEALNRFFQPLSWVMACPGLSDRDRRAHFAVEALLNLESQILVSESGFASDADLSAAAAPQQSFDTADLVDVHFRLGLAMSRFLESFDASPNETEYEPLAADDNLEYSAAAAFDRCGVGI